jgi:hypothetical protein
VTIGSIVEEAQGSTGIEDVGDDWFLAPLGAWVEDLEQPNLNDFGRRFLRTLAVRDVARRLRVLATLREHAEIGEVTIPPILYITGLERSGTTLLHNLVALHPDARALRRWELMEPLPPPETATYDTDPRIQAVQASLRPLQGSLLEHMHWVNADDPEECVWGFIDAVSMLGQAACLCMPAWRRFLFEADLTPTFQHHRQLLQLLLWRHPVPPRGFLVLKAPQIARSIDAFARTFPEAKFVITDRDPFRCLVSMAVLGAAIVDPFCHENPMVDDGGRARIGLRSTVAKLEAITSFTTSAPDRVVHVPYPSLVSDPAGTATGVLEVATARAVDLGPAVDEFLAAQGSGGRAEPPPRLDPMGYTREAVWNHPVIRSYCARAAIEPERTRLTGAAPHP